MTKTNSFVKKFIAVLLSAIFALTSFTITGFVPTMDVDAAPTEVVFSGSLKGRWLSSEDYVTDTSSKNNNLTLSSGSVNWATVDGYEALQFAENNNVDLRMNGSDTFYNLGLFSSVESSSSYTYKNGLTIAFMARPTTSISDDSKPMFALISGGNAKLEYANKGTFWVKNSLGNDGTFSSKGSGDANKWHTYVFCFKPDKTIDFYIDGTRRWNEQNAWFDDNLFSKINAIRFGSNLNGTARFNGSIRDFRVYNSGQLSATEIHQNLIDIASGKEAPDNIAPSATLTLPYQMTTTSSTVLVDGRVGYDNNSSTYSEGGKSGVNNINSWTKKSTSGYGMSVQMDWDKLYSLDTASVYFWSDNGGTKMPSSFDIEYSVDGTNFVKYKTYSSFYGTVQSSCGEGNYNTVPTIDTLPNKSSLWSSIKCTFDLSGIPSDVKSLKLIPHQQGTDAVGIAEIEVYGVEGSNPGQKTATIADLPTWQYVMPKVDASTGLAYESKDYADSVTASGEWFTSKLTTKKNSVAIFKGDSVLEYNLPLIGYASSIGTKDSRICGIAFPNNKKTSSEHVKSATYTDDDNIIYKLTQKANVNGNEREIWRLKTEASGISFGNGNDVDASTEVRGMLFSYPANYNDNSGTYDYKTNNALASQPNVWVKLVNDSTSWSNNLKVQVPTTALSSTDYVYDINNPFDMKFFAVTYSSGDRDNDNINNVRTPFSTGSHQYIINAKALNDNLATMQSDYASLNKSLYTDKSWKAYEDAIVYAMNIDLTVIGRASSDDDLADAIANLSFSMKSAIDGYNNAYNRLELKADTSALKSAISTYENKISANNFVSSLDAYKAYVNANEIVDAVDYGRDVTITGTDIQNAINTLNSCTSALSAYSAPSVGKWGGFYTGDNQSNMQSFYSQALYVQPNDLSNYTNYRKARTESNHEDVELYFPNAVLIYQGNNTMKIPVLIYSASKRSGPYMMSYTISERTVDGYDFGNPNWTIGDGAGNTTSYYASYVKWRDSSDYQNGGVTANSSGTLNFQVNKWSYYLTNTLNFNGATMFKNDTTSPYKQAMFKVQSYWKDGSSQWRNDPLYPSDSKVYVINYNPANDFINDHKSQYTSIPSSYKQGGLQYIVQGFNNIGRVNWGGITADNLVNDYSGALQLINKDTLNSLTTSDKTAKTDRSEYQNLRTWIDNGVAKFTEPKGSAISKESSDALAKAIDDGRALFKYTSLNNNTASTSTEGVYDDYPSNTAARAAAMTIESTINNLKYDYNFTFKDTYNHLSDQTITISVKGLTATKKDITDSGKVPSFRPIAEYFQNDTHKDFIWNMLDSYTINDSGLNSWDIESDLSSTFNSCDYQIVSLSPDEPNYDTNHKLVCIECGHSKEVSHEIKYRVEEDTKTINHIKYCDCGYEKTEDHTIAYRNLDGDTHEKYCSVCDTTIGVSEHHFEESFDGLKITHTCECGKSYVMYGKATASYGYYDTEYHENGSVVLPDEQKTIQKLVDENKGLFTQLSTTTGQTGKHIDLTSVDMTNTDITNKRIVFNTVSCTFDNGVVTKKPTCTTKGVKTYTCTVCGNTYTEDVEMLPHTPVTDERVEPTCTTSGLTEGSHCSVCNYVIVAQEVIPATGHKWGNYIVDPSDNTKHTRKCSVCSVYDTSVAHTSVTDARVEPTCTTSGLTEGSHCSVCNYVIVAQEVIPATGHSWGDWIEKTPATCQQKGVETRTCSVCTTTEDRDIEKLPHDYTGTERHVDATGDNNGYTEYKCVNGCDQYGGRVYDPTDWSAFDALYAEAIDIYTLDIYKDIYEESSLSSFKIVVQTYYEGLSGDKTKSQSFIDKKVVSLQDLIDGLTRKQVTVTLKYGKDGNNTNITEFYYMAPNRNPSMGYKRIEANAEGTASVPYGSEVIMTLPNFDGYVSKWLRTNDTGDYKYAASQQSVSYIANGSAVFNAITVDKNDPAEYHVVTVLNKLNRVAGYLYVEDGHNITISGKNVTDGSSTIVPDVYPFYEVKGYSINGQIIESGSYTVTSDITLTTVYDSVSKLTITLDDASDISFSRPASSAKAYNAVWDEKIVVTSESNKTWYVQTAGGVKTPVAYGTSYTFRASNSMTIYADDEAATHGTVVTCAQYLDDKRQARVICSSYKDDDRQIEEQGIFVATSTDKNHVFVDKDMLTASRIKTKTTTETGDQFSYSLTISQASKVRAFGVQSYVKYKNDTQYYVSDIVTIQSNIVD